MKLTCHLEHEQSVVFDKGEALQALEAGEPDTHLTAWFERNKIDDTAKLILYPDFPKKYTWDRGDRKWKIRQQKFNIGFSTLKPWNCTAYVLSYIMSLVLWIIHA